MSENHNSQRYEQIEHTGDIGIKVYGATLGDLFHNAAYGMFDVMVDTSGIGCQLSENVDIAAENVEELLVSWLSELNYLFITEQIVFMRFNFNRFKDNEISATVFGAKHDLRKNPIKNEIKAVTYHELYVKQVKNGWEAQIIFDI